MTKPEQLCVVYFTRIDLPDDFTNPMPAEKAIQLAKDLSKEGCDATVLKLLETHFFAGRGK